VATKNNPAKALATADENYLIILFILLLLSQTTKILTRMSLKSICNSFLACYYTYMAQFFVQSKAGSLGEELGCRYLKGKGYKILETNYCNTLGRRLGEIDIVAQKGKELVFVEVKTRLGNEKSDIVPEASITSAKLHKLERIVCHYLREKKCQNVAYHFDALSILYDEVTKKALIRHLEHIFI
jgi:putative endonuclease